MKLTSHPLAHDLHLPRVAIDRALAERLRSSFHALLPMAQRFAERFYERLFDLHPSLRLMFPEDMTEQRGKLLSMLQWTVANLENGHELKTNLEQLGRRHERYGARREQYPIVAAAMIATMAEIMGDRWNNQLHADWQTALERMAAIMLGEK